jgi:hypothetical protein
MVDNVDIAQQTLRQEGFHMITENELMDLS